MARIPSETQKPIYILLTKNGDWRSKLISWLSRSYYSHSSIGLEQKTIFYSFTTKRGFCLEKPFIKNHYIPCQLYRLDVTESVYNDIAFRIQTFSNGEYKFSYLGALFCGLRVPLRLIPARNKNSYFCSQFIAELLCSSGAAKLQKPPQHFLPKDFLEDPQFKLCYHGTIRDLCGKL